MIEEITYVIYSLSGIILITVFAGLMHRRSRRSPVSKYQEEWMLIQEAKLELESYCVDGFMDGVQVVDAVINNDNVKLTLSISGFSESPVIRNATVRIINTEHLYERRVVGGDIEEFKRK